MCGVYAEVHLPFSQFDSLHTRASGSQSTNSALTHLLFARESLLLVLATADYNMAALALFETRSLYANVWYDLSVSFSTAAVMLRNPFRDLSRSQVFCAERWAG